MKELSLIHSLPTKRGPMSKFRSLGGTTDEYSWERTPDGGAILRERGAAHEFAIPPTGIAYERRDLKPAEAPKK